jgi:hypothetical protein
MNDQDLVTRSAMNHALHCESRAGVTLCIIVCFFTALITYGVMQRQVDYCRATSSPLTRGNN